MALHPENSEEFKKVTLDDLINDAVERKDKVALEWLKKESHKKVDRTRSDGSVTKVFQSIPSIRSNYAKKFLHYTNKSSKSAELQRKRKAEKKEKELDSKFEKAFSALDE